MPPQTCPQMLDFLIQGKALRSIRRCSASFRNPKYSSAIALSTGICPLTITSPPPPFFWHNPTRFPLKKRTMITLSRCIRQSLRASLPLHPPAPRQPHRALSTSSFQNDKSKTTEVPVASYTQPTNTGAGANAAAERTTLKVDGSQPAATAVAGEDVGRKAVAFDRGLVAKMTPTMARFTLQGKVAVVTG